VPLPAGLDVDVEGELVAGELEAAGAVTETAADTVGAVTRCAAFSDAVSLTELTEVAVAGTVTLARTSRAADPEVTVPRLHEVLPSWPPQPKLNVAFWLLGVVASLMTTPEALPLSVHAPICQVPAWPRTKLVCRRCTLTHRVGCGVVAARAMNTASAAVVAGDVPGDCAELAGEDGVADPEVPVEAEPGVVLEAPLAGALDVVAGADDCTPVLVGVDELGGVAGLLLGGGVEEPALVGEVVVGVGVGVGTWTCWHCSITGELVTVPPTPPPGVVAAMLTGAKAAVAAKPAVAVKSVPPAIRPIATGRTRAKHM
jgi:hypothetical protein